MYFHTNSPFWNCLCYVFVITLHFVICLKFMFTFHHFKVRPQMNLHFTVSLWLGNASNYFMWSVISPQSHNQALTFQRICIALMSYDWMAWSDWLHYPVYVELICEGVHNRGTLARNFLVNFLTASKGYFIVKRTKDWFLF